MILFFLDMIIKQEETVLTTLEEKASFCTKVTRHLLREGEAIRSIRFSYYYGFSVFSENNILFLENAFGNSFSIPSFLFLFQFK